MTECIHSIRILVAGEHGLVIEFGSVIAPEINLRVQQLARLLHFEPIDGVMEVIPTYRSVSIYFDPLVITRQELSRQVIHKLGRIEHQGVEDLLSSRVVHVPVCYGGVLGPDLEYVSRYTGLSPQEVICIHTSKPYMIYMLGFIPGFPYLGGMSSEIAVPRQERPRERIPGGSVGIGGNQTGFYPIESAGEWWLIGRTPIKAFDLTSDNPFLFSVGDYLHFEEISTAEYFAIRRSVEKGTYVPEVSYLQPREKSH